METADKKSEAFLNLGLTKLQVEIYLSLSKLGKVPAKKISEYTKIDRAHVYQVIIKLQQIGLVEKNLSNPCIYQAIPIRDGMQILVEKKTHELDTKLLEVNRIRKIVQHFQEEKNPSSFAEDENEFTLIPGKETHTVEITKIMNRTRVSFDNVFLQNDFCRALVTEKEISPFFGHFFHNNIKVRTILCKNKQKPPKRTIEMIERLRIRGNFEFKYTKLRSLAMFGVLDNKAMFIHTGVESQWKDKPCLYSNNPCLVEMAKGYFEQLWRNAKNDPEA
jgi:sugar-specific transcriptional regulator TrmB